MTSNALLRGAVSVGPRDDLHVVAGVFKVI